jgi:hypothetical protein
MDKYDDMTTSADLKGLILATESQLPLADRTCSAAATRGLDFSVRSQSIGARSRKFLTARPSRRFGLAKRRKLGKGRCF